ncbi:MAG: ShlB/FhaC/HecB family hemolysin secretion/activation protein [Myxococcota bacterium]
MKRIQLLALWLSLTVCALAQGLTVREIVVEGNSVLPESQLRAVLAPFEGKEASLEELREAARRVEQLYRDQGYFLASALVPAQEIRDGRVRIQVLEGRVGEVRVEGNQAYSADFVRWYFAPATQRGVLHSGDLERALLILNDFEDLKVRSVLSPGKAPGTTDVTLRVDDSDPIHVGVEYNNFGNRFVGEHRAGLSVAWGNPILEGDTLAVRSVFPFPTRQVQPFLQALYGFPVSQAGDRLNFFYASADTLVGEELAVLDIRGEADIYGIQYAYPLERRLSHRADLTCGFQLKDVKNSILGNLTLSQDRIRSLNVGYVARWLTEDGNTGLSAVYTQGLGTVLGGSPNSNPVASRAGSGNSFGRLNLDASHVHQLGQGNFLLLRASGQLTGQPLTVGEQFALGGPDSVRGYVQSEFLGDRGYTLSLEYRRSVLDDEAARLQLAAFLDHGGASLENPQPGEPLGRDFTGAGVGLRLGLGERFSGRLDFGFPIAPGRNSTGQSPVIYGQFSTRF